MNKYRQWFAYVLLATGFCVLTWFFFIQTSNDNKEMRDVPTGYLSEVDIQVLTETKQDDPSVVTDSHQIEKQYINDTYGFSFSYPGSYTVGFFPDQGGEVVLVQEPGKNVGFQVFVSAIGDTEANITVDMIREELPHVVVTNPEEISVAGGDKGIAFESVNPSFGTSREVWFIFGGNLYQISGYIKSDVIIQKALASWQFAAR